MLGHQRPLVKIFLGHLVFSLKDIRYQEKVIKDRINWIFGDSGLGVIKNNPTIDFLGDIEPEVKRVMLERVEKFLEGFKFPAAEDFPQELVELVEKRIKVLEQKQLPKKEGSQDVHDPDSTAEYEVLS